MKNRASGFTLMEIIITTILVGVIASLAFSNFGVVIEKQKAEQAKLRLQAIFANTQRIKVEQGSIAGVMVEGTDPFLADLRWMDEEDYFNQVVFTVSMAPVLSYTYTITRKAPSYTLSMVISNTTTRPSITCSGGPAGLCAQLGY